MSKWHVETVKSGMLTFEAKGVWTRDGFLIVGNGEDAAEVVAMFAPGAWFVVVKASDEKAAA